jgi:Ca-activated chloride channel family protein
MSAGALADGLRFKHPTRESLVAGRTEISFSVVSEGEPMARIDVFESGRLIGSAYPPDWSILFDAPEEGIQADIYAVGYGKNGEVLDKARFKSRETGTIGKVDVQRVQFYPVVTDRSGNFVTNLDADAFVLRDEGRAVEFEALFDRDQSLNIALIVDASSSMVDKLGSLRLATARFVRRLDPDDRVSLYAFNDTLRAVVPLSLRREQLQRGLESLQASGGTALYDALTRVLGEMQKVHGRKIIMLFSDGKDVRSLASLERVISLARRSDTTLYAIGTTRESERSASRQDLLALAEETGGRAWFVDRPEEIGSIYEQVLQHLRSQYVLSYEMPFAREGLRRVEIELPGHPKLDVNHRPHYYHTPRNGDSR